MSDNESYLGGVSDIGAGITADKLAGQLGTDTADLAKNRFDMRRLSIIDKDERGILLWMKIKARKNPVYQILYDEILNLNVSDKGRGRRDIIHMEVASKGGMVSVESEIPQQNWLQRNVTDRGAKERQSKEAL